MDAMVRTFSAAAVAAGISLAAVSLGAQSTAAPAKRAGAPVAAAPAAARRWVPPQTPWGDPDLQGYWTNTTTTPLQRPAELKDKAFLTDEELAARDKLVQERANQDAAPSAGNPGTYNEFWYERGRLNRRTSLIVDTPDGRLPLLTDAAKKVVAAARK